MPGDCKYPAAVSEGTCIYMAWISAEGKSADLYFQKSADEGKKWSSARRISNKNGDCFPPSLAACSGILHLAWVYYG
jgi:hypothetical protein